MQPFSTWADAPGYQPQCEANQKYEWDPRDPRTDEYLGQTRFGEAKKAFGAGLVQIWVWLQQLFFYAVHELFGTEQNSWIVWYSKWLAARPAFTILVTFSTVLVIVELWRRLRKFLKVDRTQRGYPGIVRFWYFLEQLFFFILVSFAIYDESMIACLVVVFVIVICYETSRFTVWVSIITGDVLDLNGVVNESSVKEDTNPVDNQLIIGEMKNGSFQLAGQCLFYRNYKGYDLFLVPTHVIDSIETKDTYVTDSRIFQKVFPLRFGENIGMPFPTIVPDFSIVCSPKSTITDGLKYLDVASVVPKTTVNVSCHLMGMDDNCWRQKSVGRLVPSPYSVFVYQYDGDTAPGWSGAPVTVLNKVVGMHTTAVKNGKLSACNGGFLLNPILTAFELIFLDEDKWVFGSSQGYTQIGFTAVEFNQEAKGKNKGYRAKAKSKGATLKKYKGGAYSTPKIYEDIREGRVWAEYQEVQMDNLDPYWVFVDSRGRTYIRSYDEIPEDVINILKSTMKETKLSSAHKLPVVDALTLLTVLGSKTEVSNECLRDPDCFCGADDDEPCRYKSKRSRDQRPMTPIDHDNWERSIRLMEFYGEIVMRMSSMARMIQIALVKNRNNILHCKQLVANLMAINEFNTEVSKFGTEFSNYLEEQSIMSSNELTEKNRATRHRKKLPAPSAEPVIMQEILDAKEHLLRTQEEFRRMPARLYFGDDGDTEDEFEVLADDEALTPSFAKHMSEKYGVNSKGFRVDEPDTKILSESQVFHKGASQGAPSVTPKTGSPSKTVRSENFQATASTTKKQTNSEKVKELEQLRTMMENERKTSTDRLEKLSRRMDLVRQECLKTKDTKCPLETKQLSLHRSKSTLTLNDQCYLTPQQRKNALEPSKELAMHLDRSRLEYRMKELQRNLE